MRAWWTWIQAFAALATVLSAVLVPAAFVANAAGGTLYLDQATDPHGEIWLPKTVDGTATGALSTVPTDGHLWATDVPLGFCRVDAVVDPVTGAVTHVYARTVTGGCTHTGQKSSQAVLDPRRNADGTLYVYSCDWAVFSLGCYRMKYDPGAQIMTGVDNLAAGRFPQSKKPFATVLGQDGNLYVSSDLTPYIYKFTNPNTPNVGDMTVSIVAQGNAQQRARAITATCWDPLRGGVTGLPTCAQSAAAGNAAPDLIMDQKTAVTVILDYAKCPGVPVDLGTGAPSGLAPSCTANSTPIRVLTAMGAWTQGAWDRPVTAIPAAGTVTTAMPAWGPNFNPNVIYISNSSGAVSEIVRYTITTNTQDSYSNFATFPDGTTRQFAFAFSPTQGPDGTMYIGDDPCAGAQAFCGALWTVAPNAPADVLGAPGAPASPPPPAAQKVGTLYGSGDTLPQDGVWLPLYSDAAGTTVAFNADGTPTGHLWLSDAVANFCRMDPNPTPGTPNPPTASGAPFFLNTATCDVTTKKPGQPSLDPKPQLDGSHFVYLPDDAGGSKGEGLFRLTYDWAGNVCTNPDGSFKGPESVCNGTVVAPGQGLAGQRASATAIDPTTGTVYVGFRARNLTAITQIARVTNPGSAAPTVDFVATTDRQKPVFTLAFIGADMYIGDGGGLSFLPKPASCPPDGCKAVQILNLRGPRGMVTDGVDKIYMAGPIVPAGCPPTCPAPGTSNTNVTVFSAATGSVSFFSSQGAFNDPAQTLGLYDVINSLTLDPQGNLYVADDPNILGIPATQGRVWKVPFTGQEPLPAIQSKPHNPTNNTNPTFQFASADLAARFQCSLVAFGAKDSFTACTSPVTYGAAAAGSNTALIGSTIPLPDGNYVFKVQGTNPTTGLTSFAAAYGFTIDTAAPVVTITKAPKSPTNVNTPSYSFSANKLGTLFQCSLSTGLDAFQFCQSPLTYPAQPDGNYTFKVQGTDPAGNVTTVTSPLIIDTVAPTVSASPVGGQFTAPQNVVLTATTSNPAVTATIFYTTDGTTPTTASPSGASPVTVNIASSATLQYFATDTAGNVGAVASQKYQIGAITITSNPATLGKVNTPTFTWTDATAGATFSCSLVLQTALDSFSPCTSPKTYAAQPDGAYRFMVKDKGGSSAQFLFTIDTTPPVVTFTQNPANPDTSNSGTFAWTADEAVSGYQCSFGLQTAPDTFAPCTSPVTETSLANGSYVFKVIGTDLAGNTSSPVAYFFNVNAAAGPTVTAPVASLTGLTTATTGTTAVTTAAGPITATTNQVPVTISWTGTACQSGVTNCNIDHYILEEQINGTGFGAPLTLPAPNATSVTLNLKPSPTNNPSAATNYQFKVQAVDTAGNFSTFAVSPSFQVPDTDNSFNSSFNGSWTGVNISSAFGGSVAESSTAGSTANPQNAAPATSLAWVSTLGPDRGKAQVKIDGQIVATVDLYAPTQSTAQVVWSINGLAPGVNHTIQIVSTGTKNTASSATKVDYDAILAVH